MLTRDTIINEILNYHIEVFKGEAWSVLSSSEIDGFLCNLEKMLVEYDLDGLSSLKDHLGI